MKDWMKVGAPALALGICMLAVGAAQAGIPECGNIRIDAGAHCELLLGGSGECSGSCSLGVYEKACATQQYESCQEVCTLDPNPTCTDGCTEECAEQCEVGIEVVCHGNCFPECVGECTLACEGAQDSIQCRASCEATCDGECDHQCAQLPVDASCYSHCMECCGGSCSAAANMDCQVSCQTETWEDCEYGVQAECEGACDVDGALFCDGQFIVGGEQLQACAAALAAIGIAVAEDVINEVDDTIQEWEQAERERKANGGCQVGAEGRPAAWGTGLLLGLLGLRRRRRGR
ncbi:MAG: hypothetical protein KDK70_04640 [Myxococcales bacterium]|nr:hypothetical protein [Myxococcales bacterium]